MSKQEVKKVVLAYSGGLDTSVIVPWLIENYGCEVVCFTADVGQGDELEGLEQKAIASGASQCIIVDLKEEFGRDYIFRIVRAGAVYERKYLLGTSMARPLIAKYQVETAHQVGADALAHGATGKGNDQVRFELTYAALDPRLKVIAPLARVGYPFKRRCPGVCPKQGHTGPGNRKIQLQPGRQPVAPFTRGGSARRPLAGTGTESLSAHGQTRRGTR